MLRFDGKSVTNCVLGKFLNFGGLISLAAASAARKTIDIGRPIFDIGNGGSFDFERQLAKFLTGK
jgi:hypothetical protein